MFTVNKYRFDLTDPVRKLAYGILCEKFASEYRILQFSPEIPKRQNYQVLINKEYFWMHMPDFEVVLDWCEQPSEAHIRQGYWLALPPGTLPLPVIMGTPDRPAPLVYSNPTGRAPSALQQAVEWQHATGCTQAEACRMFGASQSNFKITRDRMLARGVLKRPAA
jgi:hypothetical protein